MRIIKVTSCYKILANTGTEILDRAESGKALSKRPFDTLALDGYPGSYRINVCCLFYKIFIKKEKVSRLISLYLFDLQIKIVNKDH